MRKIRNHWGIIAILLQIFVLFPVAAGAQAVIVVNQTPQACAAGSAYYSAIQTAVDAAASGDTILVCPGTYNENVDVTKSLTVKSFSQKPSDVIVQAANANDHVFDIKASWVNISGFTAQNATGVCGGYGCGGFYSGVYWPAVVGHNITNVVAVNNYRGVFMRSGNSVLANSVLANNSDGVYIYATNNIIVNNTISNSNNAITVLMYNNTIANNSLKNNIVGISVNGDYNYINNNSIENSSNWAIFLSGKSNFLINNFIINSGYYGIAISPSSEGTMNNIIKGNIISNHSYAGIELSGTSLLITNNTISENLITYNTQTGIRLHKAFNNRITKNQLINNPNSGIFLYESSNNIIENNIVNNSEFLQSSFPEGIGIFESNNTFLANNTITNNGHGIYIRNSFNATITNNEINRSRSCNILLQDSNAIFIYHNNLFLYRNYQGCDNSNNSWDNGYYKGGNYWSNWVSPDNLRGAYQNESGSDGIVDYPYNISSGTNKDRYPFVKPSGWLDWGTKFSVSSYRPYANANITIPISFSTAVPVGSAQLYLLYNPSVINATNITAGSASQGALFSSKINNSEGKITIVLVSVDGISSNDSIAEIEFKAVGSVNSSTALKLVSEGVTDTKNNELNAILKDGNITIISYPVGDVTGDNEITVADALMYLRFSAGETVDNANPLLDVNCDGKITAADALLVLRKAVGQEVSLEC